LHRFAIFAATDKLCDCLRGATFRAVVPSASAQKAGRLSLTRHSVDPDIGDVFLGRQISRKRRARVESIVPKEADARSPTTKRALLDAAVEWARGRDLELLIVWPSDEAVGLYGRAGFVPAADVLQMQLRDYYDPSWSDRAD